MVFLFIGAISGNSVARKAFQINEACQDSKARNFQSLKVGEAGFGLLVSHLKQHASCYPVILS